MRKLCKSRDKQICGVCGGFAEYFGWDPSIVRIAWALIVLLGGASLWIYIIAAIIMPEADE